MKKFQCEIQVRGYELDGYGHVNHSVYFNYAEYARWRMIEDSGAGKDYFSRKGVFPVVVRAEIDYREPCFLADWIVLETELIEIKTRRAVFLHRVLKKDSGKLCAELKVFLVGIDKTQKAVSLPDDFEKLFS